MGGLHMEKLIFNCCGKYLAKIRFLKLDSVLVENKTYEPNVVKSVEVGGKLIRGK